MINTYKAGKHFQLAITATSFSYHRDTAKIDAKAELDCLYVLRTPMPATSLDTGAAVTAYKTWPTSNATSATSRPTTWTCAPSGTGSKNASKPTC